MKSHRTASSLCKGCWPPRASLSPRQIPNIQRRCASNSHLNFDDEPYQISQLLLDLDADSNLARPWKESDDQAQKALENVTLKQAKTIKPPGVVEESPSSLNHYLTERHLMALAFEYPADPKGSVEGRALNHLLKHRGLFPGLGHRPLMSYLILKKSNSPGLPHVREDLQHVLTADNVPRIKQEISECTDLRHLAYLLSIISRTESGCKTVIPELNTDIISAIKRCKHQDTPRAGHSPEILSLLGNLEASLARFGLELSRHLHEEALRWSFFYTLPGTKHHIEKLFNGGFWSLGIIHSTMRRLRTYVPASLDADTRNALLRIITGWEEGGVPNSKEEQEPCFRLLCHLHIERNWHAQNRDQDYERYLELLFSFADLKAVLWEWNTYAKLRRRGKITKSSEVLNRYLGIFDKFKEELGEDEWFRIRKQVLNVDTLVLPKTTNV